MKPSHIILIITAMAGLVSCKKFVETTPTDKTTGDITFSSVKNAENAVTGMYANMVTQGNIYGNRLYTDISLMSDELKTSSITSAFFADNNVSPDLSGSFWNGPYAIINHTNIVIDHLPGVPGIQPAQVNMWTAQARFLRAWNYLFLSQLYGKVPKITASALLKENAVAPRSEVEEIRALILSDLVFAEASLPHDYGDAEKDRTFATKAAARALLAKFYMIKNDWKNAQVNASAVINDSTTYKLEKIYADVFKSGSKESIWELAFSEKSPNGVYNSFLFGARAQYSPSAKIVTAFNASANDTRTTISVGGGKVNKYPSNLARPKLLRVGDLYLLRAEAKAQQDSIQSALADLNIVRTRAGVTPLNITDKAALLLAIEQERYLELAFEGQRWFDLVRTGRAGAVLGALKPQTWKSTDVLLPVPQAEILLNANLLPQNPL